jgi:hypothetical protein
MSKQHKKTTKFADRAKRHMAEYRLGRLGIAESGTWRKNGKAYAHILPEAQKQANIVKPIRDEFWRDFADYAKQGVKLHDGFHHLNSSQAMCFSLFYPYVIGGGKEAEVLQRALGMPVAPVRPGFEKVLRTDEGTNFDFCMEYPEGAKMFFELKYTEAEFAGAAMDERHLRKYEAIYRPQLERLLVPERRSDAAFFFKHYQIFRNVLYLLEHEGNLVFFVFPEGNAGLAYISAVLKDTVMPEFQERIRVLHLETLVAKLMKESQEYWHRHPCTVPVSLMALAEFMEKYLPELDARPADAAGQGAK